MKRIVSCLALVTLIGALCGVLACATGDRPLRSGPAPAEIVDGRWSVHVVTPDEDGGDRVTRIWIAMLDGQPVIRTGESRWWQNLERDPAIRLRVEGVDRAYEAESVTSFDERVRIDEAFLEKYDWMERMMFPQDRGETHANYARLRPVADSTP